MNQAESKKPYESVSRDNYLKLLSMIAHNVKGPVKYMEFITDYTLQNWETLSPTDLAECAGVINESARNISEQLGNLLSWARLQDGTFRPNYKPLNLLNAINEELRLQYPICRIKQLKIINQTNAAIEVKSDLNLFNLAFHNIITNAIKFTKKGGTITLESSILNGLLILSVSDTGVGMSPEDLALVYDNESFSKPGTINEPGSGFGLHIAKELIELLHGNIEVDSQQNVGTTVTICIPVTP